MNTRSIPLLPTLYLCLGLLAAFHPLGAQEAAKSDLARLEQDLGAAKKEQSATRQRLALRRVIRDAEKALVDAGDKPDRWALLEFLFRAQQRLISLDDDSKHRAALLAICKELVAAPDDFAVLRMEADLLFSQVEQVKKSTDLASRAGALRAFADRYANTPAAAKALRAATLMAIELGDDKLMADLRNLIAFHCATDLEMIAFQRDHFGGQVFGATFAGDFKRSDGKLVCLPMDHYGHSVMILFWSKEGEGLDFVRGMAEAAKILPDQLEGRSKIISFNLDDLPDAGESIIHGLGVDWDCFHLPGGRENPVFKTYARKDPLCMKVSSTGQVALVMEGLSRVLTKADGSVDHESIIRKSLDTPWTHADYCVQLHSLSAGDFLIFDPEGAIDPARPPELKAVSGSKPLERRDNSVPEETLRAIQNCFVAPVTCYQCPHVEMLDGYRKAVDLCRQAIAQHADAPDLWVVRNRLIIALMGLWKTESNPAHLEQAFVEAKAAMETGYPAGGDLVARFCLARQALRSAEADHAGIIDAFVSQSGGDKSAGPALAAAATLALDVAERGRFERYRALILKQHTEEPMMWLYASSLLDRHHDYWRFQVPFYVGYSYPQREAAFRERGEAEGSQRMLKAELLTAEGKAFRIPEDLTADYTAIFFTLPGPWDEKGLADLPASPFRAVTGFAVASAGRPSGSVQTIMTVLADKPLSEVAQDRNGKEFRHPFAMMALPGGTGNPLVHRLGLLFAQGFNSVLVDKQGRILCMISGIARSTMISEIALTNALTHQDALKVDALLAKGEVDAARRLIRAFTPEEDPTKYCSDHLRARARVHRAAGELDKALADIKELIARHQKLSDRSSEKTVQHADDEAFRDEIIRQMEEGANTLR